MIVENSQKPSKKNLGLLLGIVAGFVLLSSLSAFWVGTEAAQAFAGVGLVVTIICIPLLITSSQKRKSCSTNTNAFLQ